MNDTIIVGVDDHLIETADMYDNRLSGNALATAPDGVKYD